MFTNINHVHGKNIQAIKMFSFLKYLLHLRSQLIILLPISLKKEQNSSSSYHYNYPYTCIWDHVAFHPS